MTSAWAPPLVVAVALWRTVGTVVRVVDIHQPVGKLGAHKRVVTGTPRVVVGKRAVVGTRVVAGTPPVVAGTRTAWRSVAGKHCRRPVRLAPEPVAGPVDLFPVVCRPAATVGSVAEICTGRTLLA